MTEIIVAISAFLAATLGAGVTWRVAKRTTSGEIDTSDAAQLWTESQDMRRGLRDEVVVLKAKVGDLETQREDLRDTIAVMKVELAGVKAEVKRMQDVITTLKVSMLEDQEDKSHASIP